MTTPPVADRVFVRQFSNDEILGLSLNVAGVPTDPEDSAVTVTMTNDDTGAVALDKPATRASLGRYEVTLDGTSTDVPGYYTLTFFYQMPDQTETERYSIYVEIGSGVQEYDELLGEFQDVVDNVKIKFADLFDSPQGGPHLITYYQTHFTPARYAQLLRAALGTMNTISQPYMNYTLDGEGGPKFPLSEWGALLEKALYIEVIRHLRRSYVEQPTLVGGEVTRHDRRDYFDRWGIVLNEELEAFNKQLETFKIRHMMSGGPRVLVSGGAYGRYGPTRLPVSAAARPRYYARWY
jgi:hypothetical protein